jgi:hypothetical protein
MSKSKTPREPIPQPTVLGWLNEHHPQLVADAEIDRAWVWLKADLRGEQNKPIREGLKKYGFIFSRRGGHPLPSGGLGTWGHSCLKPMPFKRRRKGQSVSTGRQTVSGQVRTEPEADADNAGNRFDPFSVTHSEPDPFAEAIAFAMGTNP